MKKFIIYCLLFFVPAIYSSVVVSEDFVECPEDSWENDEGKCIKFNQRDISLQKLGGYDSCLELKAQLFDNEEGVEFVSEDMSNFDWEYSDLQKALKICRLPSVPKYYFD